MFVPQSFHLAYWAFSATATAVGEVAANALRNEVAEPNEWLFAGRVKGPESALVKLEIGRYESLADVHDLYACTIVVPTRSEIDAAVDAVKMAFPHHRIARRRRGRADSFAYDDIHIVAQLGSRVAAWKPELQTPEFEIQVRTGLQFAWWRATHDELYKGPPSSWRLRRLASQARATLELLDATLANMKGAAELLESRGSEEDSDADRRAKWSVHFARPLSTSTRPRRSS